MTKPLIFHGMLLGISKRKRAEEALIESEKRYRSIFNSSLNLVYIHDFQGRFLEANDAALDSLGYTREEITSLSFQDLVSGDELGKAINQLSKIMETGIQSEITEFHLRSKNGEKKTIETTSSMLTRDGRPYAILGIGRDITLRRKYLEKLEFTHSEINHLLDAIASILIGVSLNDTITHWNRVAEETFGIREKDAVGKKIMEFGIKWDWDKIYSGILKCLSDTRQVYLPEIKYLNLKGKSGLLGMNISCMNNSNGECDGFLIYGKDITEAKIVERQLLQSSKLATIGELATGVAHEINQPLNIIRTASQFLLDGIKKKYYTEEFLRERIDKIIKQVDRAAHIIDHLREFGRKSDYDMQSIDPNQTVRIAFDMMSEQLHNHSIKSVLELGNLPLILGDMQKLEQVFINLIVNAMDAFDEKNDKNGEKYIYARSYYNSDAELVCIEFNDNGPGIPDEIADRIFEPFFTTKETSKGTGLGLSISYGIIKSHHGTIELALKNEGTKFVIRMPVYSEATALNRVRLHSAS